MGLRDDFRKIEGIKLAVGQDLPARTVYHKDPFIDRRQKFHGLINEGGIFSQE